MPNKHKILIFFISFNIYSNLYSQKGEMLVYHNIKVDKNGYILPWYSNNLGNSYNYVINKVWDFWYHMRSDYNGLPYYMNHQVWNSKLNDPRGVGGDQFAMALSSWRMYYQYSGNENVKENMLFIADYYLSHGFSSSKASWPNLPFPYNTMTYSGIYDGDMRNGLNVTQPDKAGSFGYELLNLYKMSKGYNINENSNYLENAIKIANTLSEKIQTGDKNHSPLPFKVNVLNGKIQLLRFHDFTNTWIDSACYTTNWSSTMSLFIDLIKMKKGDTASYKLGFSKLLDWMKEYPLKTNQWGPFFEDVDWWSDTQINAMTFARFIMEHKEYFPNWKNDVLKIILWVHQNFSNTSWSKYGVIVTNEQTVYQMPANSHSARQASDELFYVSETGDSLFYENAIRELNWATYMVNENGANKFPSDEHWLTDGYGDYVRHFLRAMSTNYKLVPSNENHIIYTNSVIQQADYEGNLKKFYNVNFSNIDTSKVILFYRTYDSSGIEKIKLKNKPNKILIEGKEENITQSENETHWTNTNNKEGVLTIIRKNGRNVVITHK